MILVRASSTFSTHDPLAPLTSEFLIMLKKLKDILVPNIFGLSVGYTEYSVGQDRKVENSNQRGLQMSSRLTRIV